MNPPTTAAGGAPVDDLTPYVDEYAHEGFGPLLYTLARRIAAAVIFAGRYPPSYSPTGRWDEDDVAALAHEWIERKLLRGHLVEHLLLANTSARGLRKGLELSFTDFLVGQRRRSIADNLWRRAAHLLERDERFVAAGDGASRATRPWALTAWQDVSGRQVPEAELLAAAVRVPGPAAIRYRSGARKFTPVLVDRDLADLLARLLAEIGAPLTLPELLLALRHRFGLHDPSETSLDRPLGSADTPDEATLGDVLAADLSVEETVLTQEAAEEVLRELPTRRQRVLYEYARRGATLSSVAERIGCSKSTVDNDVRAAMEAIARHASSTDEARAIYHRVLDLIGGG